MTGSTADATSSEPTGERFDPALMHGHLIEAEHLARYAWAAQFAAGRRVLDAACGMAYGSAILAGAGAAEVVGVDLDADVVAKVNAAAKPNTRFEVADVLRLPYGDDEFDLVVSFETIEHVEDPDAAIEELARVLKPDGLLIVSTPNRDVYTPGNPFHLRELAPTEFTDALSRRFGSVAIRRQHTWVASGIFDDEAFAVTDHEKLDGVDLRKATTNRAGEETYTIGLASDGELPVGTGLVSLTADVDIREWSARLDAADLALATAPLGGGSEAEVELLRAEIAELREQLADAEGEHARFTELEARLAETGAALAQYEALNDRYQHLHEQYEVVTNSTTWRLSGALRRLIVRLRGLRP